MSGRQGTYEKGYPKWCDRRRRGFGRDGSGGSGERRFRGRRGSAANGFSADSPGVVSGNTVQLPVHVPVNVCGNTVNVVGLLNPAVGNSCVNRSAGGKHAAGKATFGGSAADGSGKDSPGVVSGNTVQLPLHVPVNVSGNTANVVGVGNAAVGNESRNSSGRAHHRAKPAPKPSAPAKAHPQQVTAQRTTPLETPPSLAHTGADQTPRRRGERRAGPGRSRRPPELAATGDTLTAPTQRSEERPCRAGDRQGLQRPGWGHVLQLV